ncbi:MAG: transcriptional repressor LexA [Chlorobiaceae bacterium]|nr:transcriptional repressor LexA [Chlorobiaceae bacterium]MBA4310171.1 transcriptional repressor LexA [Chlorobiaceae bacterium]
MKKELTDRQKEVLDFILQFRNEIGYPPTLREIGKRFNISSTFGVKRHLEALVKKGFINIEGNASRGISFNNNDENDYVKFDDKIISNDDVFSQIPILGRVAAGTPILASENIEGSIVVDRNFVKKAENCFALKVKGDSMINAGIFEGDFVIVNQTIAVNNNEIIVALIDNEATVKRFRKEKSKSKLLPENDNYSPIDVTNNQNFQIVGKVIGVVRWFN